MTQGRLAALVGAAIIAGCGGSTPGLPVASASASLGQPALVDSVKPPRNAHCQAFQASFQALVACQRASGTLGSFTNPRVTWRVRYYVRYWEMPCGEAPTEQEAYVFHMVTNDLYADTDLNEAERIQIRDIMFLGKVRCKT